MKKLIFLFVIIMSISITAQDNRKGAKDRIKPNGFKFNNGQGQVTITGWEDRGGWSGYQYTMKLQSEGVTVYGWTTDDWIDYYTNKAYLQDGKFIRYDSEEYKKLLVDNKVNPDPR